MVLALAVLLAVLMLAPACAGGDHNTFESLPFREKDRLCAAAAEELQPRIDDAIARFEWPEVIGEDAWWGFYTRCMDCHGPVETVVWADKLAGVFYTCAGSGSETGWPNPEQLWP